MKRLNQLDGLRFLMILIIVLSHFEFLNECNYGEFYAKHLDNATMAVDYFFMLSGFGLMYSMHNKKIGDINAKKCVKFGVDKIKKIYPLYIFSIIISIPIMILLFRENILKLLKL